MQTPSFPAITLSLRPIHESLCGQRVWHMGKTRFCQSAGLPSRGRLREVAAETCEIIGSGLYETADGTCVNIFNQIKEAKELSTCYASFQHLRNQTTAQFKASRPCAAVQVTPEKTIACARRVRNELGRDARIAVLNFASAKNPGGGFLNGAIAQEESLARASALYGCLTKHHDTYYALNRDTHDGIYTDHIIWSPCVPVFRDDPDDILTPDPYQVSFITLPAVNAGVVANRVPQKQVAGIVQENMRRRIRMVLHTAAANQTDVLILGAFGCGCFRNHSSDVARWFGEELQRDGALYLRQFQKIVFAIYDTSVAQDAMKSFTILGNVLGRFAQQPCGPSKEEKKPESQGAREARDETDHGEGGEVTPKESGSEAMAGAATGAGAEEGTMDRREQAALSRATSKALVDAFQAAGSHVQGAAASGNSGREVGGRKGVTGKDTGRGRRGTVRVAWRGEAEDE